MLSRCFEPTDGQSSAGSDDGIQHGGKDVQMQVPALDSNASLRNKTMACMIGMYLSSSEAGLNDGTQPMERSR